MLTLSQLLGYPHYDTMLADLTARQITHWREWLRHYHAFPSRNDRYFALLCNAWYQDKSPDDFMIYVDPEDRWESDMDADTLRQKLGLRAK